MLITLNQLKASLVAFKNWVLARIPSKTSDLTNDSNFITTADIPISNDTTLGLAKPVQEYGTISDRNGGIAINSATSSEIREGRNSFKPIVPYSQHDAVYYGLIKIANDTDRRYSAEDATAIRALIGSPSTLDIPTKVSDLVDDSGHYTKPSTGIPASDLASGVVPVQDVQINRGSLLDSYGVANIPNAGIGQLGVAQTNPNYGTISGEDGIIRTCLADGTTIKTATNTYNPIVPSNQHTATFYGLAKAAGDSTQSASSNPVGTYTDSAKTSIKTMLGVEDPVDVQINGTSIVDNGVANIPIASGSTLGVVKAETTYGLDPTASGLRIYYAHPAVIKAGIGQGSLYQPIVPANQHQSVFYGLAKAAGHDEKDSTLAVGTYTDEAKAAIKTMLGVEEPVDVQINGTSIVDNGVANIPLSSTSNFGVAKTNSTNGVYTDANGVLTLSDATDLSLRLGNNTKYAVNTARQHAAAFYGLAKAAGDTTQSAASSNPVGTYTDEAKTAIQTMLGIDTVISNYDSEIKEYIDARSAAGSTIVSVSGTTPTISADAGSVYVCGELISLNFTPPNTGVTTVVFTSGSTATELTLPSTVKMPDWFVMEANRVYEISISLGQYGTVMSWAV